MKVSLNIAQYYSNVDLKSIPTNEMLRKIGAQLGAVEDYEDWGAKYDGVLVAKVVSCEKHPNADKLSVCMIDVGELHSELRTQNSELIQVVCGAPNVREGLTVAWIPPGAAVPKSHDEAEPFVLGKREIRGVVSNGMLASPSELALFDNHDGILEIDAKDVGEDLVKPGTDFKKLYGCDDVVIDCENKMFTHRPDCFGIIGVARELAGINGLPYTSPDWYVSPQIDSAKNNLKLTTKNPIPEKIARFMAQSVEGVQNGESPVWLKAALTRLGSRPISSLVDLSNFYMHLTAQPTHAFDYDKLVKAAGTSDICLYPRFAKKGETIALLNGKTIELTEDDVVISCNDVPVALGGIMGGAETECDENTENIVIECATFDMYMIRRTSMRHGLFTDAVTRFNKGQSPRQNHRVLAKMTSAVIESCGGKAGEILDTNPEWTTDEPSVVQLSAEYINARLGSTLSSAAIVALLSLVECGVVEENGTLTVHPPFWRMDIEQPEDVVEEVGRLHGFDKLPVTLPARAAKPTPRNGLLDYKNTLRSALKEYGANEVLTYSFVHGDLLKKTGVETDTWAYHIRNAVSPDLQYYRTSLMPSLLQKVHGNLKSDMVRSDDNEFAIFEIGKAHVKGETAYDEDLVDNRADKEKLPKEFERLALVFAADEKTAGRKYSGAAFYQAKHFLIPLLKGKVTFEPLTTNDYPITSPYELKRSATIKVNGELLGVIGEYKSPVKKALKLPQFCAGFELDLTLLSQHSKARAYQPISVLPKTQQDMTLAVAGSTNFSDVIELLWSELETLGSEKGYQYTLLPRDIFQKDGSESVNMTFRLWLWHPEKTLTTDEANGILGTLAEAAKAQLKAERV